MNKTRTSLRQIRRARELIGSLRGGAFSPLSAHPVVRSLLIPFGGYGAIQLAELAQRLMS